MLLNQQQPSAAQFLPALHSEEARWAQWQKLALRVSRAFVFHCSHHSCLLINHRGFCRGFCQGVIISSCSFLVGEVPQFLAGLSPLVCLRSCLVMSQGIPPDEHQRMASLELSFLFLVSTMPSVYLSLRAAFSLPTAAGYIVHYNYHLLCVSFLLRLRCKMSNIYTYIPKELVRGRCASITRRIVLQYWWSQPYEII